MRKVFLGVGHGGRDPGACANGLREADVALSVALACRDELVRHGVSVGISRTTDENDRLAEEIRECNAYSPDLAVEIHFNAGGGRGAEIYIQQGRAASVALGTDILNRIVALGQTSRGLKYNAALGWTRQVTAPAVLVEGAFLDSNDFLHINTAEKQRAFGRAYAWGILDALAINVIPEKQEDEMVIYKTQQDIPDWAQATVTKLIAKGALQGEDGALNLEHNALRNLVINDRMGLYD